MATNDFQAFGNAAGANVLSQADYLALAARLSGFTAGTANSAQLNKVWRQSSVMANVLAQCISDITRQDVLDNGSPATILANLKAALAAGSPAAGGAINASMYVSAASATATFTADEVIVKSALGGSSWLLPSFSKTINLGATGAGGMDTGTAPANGFVAIYAIYNPTTGASALLGVNATSVKAPEIYGGANMPAGYTASALVSVWPVHTVAGQFAVGNQYGREVYYPQRTLLNTTSPVTTKTALSISGGVPINARVAHLAQSVTQSTAGSGVSLVISSTANDIANIGVGASVSGQTSASSISSSMPMIIAQTIYYVMAALTAGTFNIYSRGYTF